MALRCDVRTAFVIPCLSAATAICGYCRRAFCEPHGSVYPGGVPACSRSRCQMQATVIATAHIARARSSVLNREGLCGRPACGSSATAGDCTLCLGLYCTRHLNSKSFRVLKSSESDRDDTPRRYAWERHYLCDACSSVIDKFHLISLPPIPAGIPENLELAPEAPLRQVIELGRQRRKSPALGVGVGALTAALRRTSQPKVAGRSSLQVEKETASSSFVD